MNDDQNQQQPAGMPGGDMGGVQTPAAPAADAPVTTPEPAAPVADPGMGGGVPTPEPTTGGEVPTDQPAGGQPQA